MDNDAFSVAIAILIDFTLSLVKSLQNSSQELFVKFSQFLKFAIHSNDPFKQPGIGSSGQELPGWRWAAKTDKPAPGNYWAETEPDVNGCGTDSNTP
jgi:hypothetical protein